MSLPQSHNVKTTQSHTLQEKSTLTYGYKKLIVWQKADALAFDVYKTTKNFPISEQYGLTSQLRRSALSVCLNIIEGCGRQSKKELKQYINIALGSLSETDYLIDFSLRLDYLNQQNHERLQNIRQQTGALLWNFYRSLI